jgi:hypothetical protein
MTVVTTIDVTGMIPAEYRTVRSSTAWASKNPASGSSCP